MRNHQVIFVTAIAAVALAAAGASEAGGGAKPLAGLLKRAVNIAIRRPCQPKPICSNLVDGSSNLTVPNQSLRGRRSGPNGTQLEAGLPLEWLTSEAFSSSSKIAQPFLVQLGQPRMVTQIVIHCKQVDGSLTGDARQSYRLQVMVWAQNKAQKPDFEEPEGGATALERLGHPDKSWAWDSRKLVQEGGPAISPEGIVKIVVRLEYLVAVVGVKWAAPLPGNDVAAESIGGLLITEVAVMASQSQSAEALEDKKEEPPVAEERRMAATFHTGFGLWAEPPPRTTAPAQSALYTTTIQMHRPQAELIRDTLASSNSTQNYTVGVLETLSQLYGDALGGHVEGGAASSPASVLEPAGFLQGRLGGDDLVTASGALAAMRNSIAGLPVLALFGLLATVAVCLPCFCRAKHCSSDHGVIEGCFWSWLCWPVWHSGPGRSGSYSYDPLPEAEFEGQAQGQAPDQADLASEPLVTDRGHERSSPAVSRAPSPAVLERSSSTEPEPEGELDPHSEEEGRSPGTSRHSEIHTPMLLQRPELLDVSPASTASPSTGRFMLLYASPLCYRDSRGMPKPLPQIPFEREWEAILQAHNEAASSLREDIHSAPNSSNRPRPGTVLSAQPLTASTLQRALAPVAAGGPASVLHLSAHGLNDCLVMEDGKGTAHLLNCQMLQGMLELHRTTSQGGLRLVLLNACSLRAAGMQLAGAGVPHVICCSIDLRDLASHVFLCAFYGNLFQGSSVARAFHSGLVALRSHSERAAQAAADHFCLLPEGSRHDEVLFPPQLPESEWPRNRASRTRSCSRLALVRARASEGSTSDSSGSSGSGPWPRASSPESTNSSGECESLQATESSSSSDRGEEEHGTRARDRSADLIKDRREQLLCAKVVSQGITGHRRPARTSHGGRLAFRRPLLAQNCASGWLREAQWSHFGRPLPLLPEDFLGRELDVWAVLQHFSHQRRAVVVSASAEAAFGVGKSAVLDAVHRAYVLQMGGLCVAVPLNALSAPQAPGAWIEKTKAGVRATIKECRELWFPQSSLALARRATGGIPNERRLRTPGLSGVASQSGCFVASVKPGFHPLSDPAAAGPALDELVEEMLALDELLQARCREWPAAQGRILLVLDEADHLIQQTHFQDAVADLLQRVPSFSLLLSTHQPMVGTAGGRFKVVHHKIQGLQPLDAAKLFLRRANRPLRWGELRTSQDGKSIPLGGPPSSPVILNKGNESEVLSLVANQACIAELQGNPRRLIELASTLEASLPLPKVPQGSSALVDEPSA